MSDGDGVGVGVARGSGRSSKIVENSLEAF